MAVDVREELAQWLLEPEHRKAFGTEDYKAELAKLIYETRKAEGLTQEKFGKLLGVSQPYVAKLESGEANPTIGVVGAMFAFFWLRIRSKTERLGPPSRPETIIPNGEFYEAQELSHLDVASREKRMPKLPQVSTAGAIPIGGGGMFDFGATTAAGAMQ